MAPWLSLVAATALAGTPTNGPKIHERMATQFELTTRIERSVVSGDLDGVHEAAKALRSLPSDEVPEAWGPWMEDLTTFARMAAEAETTADAAKSLVVLGEACASCHEPINGGPKLDSDKVPTQKWEGATHMTRHQWATTWMWLGIIKPDLAAYRRGAEVLVEQPLLDGTDHPSTPEAAQGLDAQVHEFAQKALEATDAHSRATVYADLLTTCSTCHTALETEAATP